MEINIRRLAINILNLEKSKPKISDKLFPLGSGNKIINDFFRQHVLDTREGKATKSCNFYDKDASIKVKSERYFQNNGDNEFLTFSKEVTENLFTIMKNTSSTSSGTFFVLEVEINHEACMFLIKLDPRSGVQINEDELTVSALENILPDSNNRVHKCAIIRYNKPEEENAELYVMDKQQKEGEAARFFIDTFLQAEELLNDKIITKEVIKATKSDIISIVPEKPQHEVFESIEKEFTNGSRKELRQSVINILEDLVPPEKKDRELFIMNSVSDFVSKYLDNNPDHNNSFVVERMDRVIIWKAEKDQIYFRFNKGVNHLINFSQENGKQVIKIDNSLNFKRK